MIANFDNIRLRIKQAIISAFELDVVPENIPNEVSLADSLEEVGMELDSLAALEILVALSEEFDIALTEINQDVFKSINTLTDYILHEMTEE